VWFKSIETQDGKVVQEGEILTLVECRPITRPTENGSAAPTAVAGHAGNNGSVV
jgi:hypothetical protein